MNRLLLRSIGFFVCALAMACAKSATQPTPSTTAVSIPDLLSPAANTQIKDSSQPVTLVVRNATVQGTATPTYTFEVATDAAFANKVATKAGIAQSASGQTSVTLDRLAPGADYYWRAHGEAGAAIGALSAIAKFSIGPTLSVDAPVLLSPASGARTTPRPTFRVRNAVTVGPVGAITYRFEVATSSDFSTVVVTATQAEGNGETAFTPTSSLPSNATLFWRVTAIDAVNSISSPSAAVQLLTSTTSAAESIAEKQGVTLWPGAQPTGNNGRSAISAGWEIGNRVSYDGQPYFNPPIEALRLFDLMDRGMDPDSAINWLRVNGYPSTGQWYPEVAVIGIPHVYLALIDGAWELVHRAGG